MEDQSLSERLNDKNSTVHSCSNSELNNLLRDLVGILETEIDLYNELIETLRKQRDYFGSVSSFEETTKRQGTTILKIKTLEEARKSIVSHIARHFNISEESATLANISQLIEQPYKGQLHTYRQNILSIIKDLENLRDSNSYLIQHSLKYVSGILRIFAFSQDNKYSNSGQIKSRNETGKHISGWG